MVARCRGCRRGRCLLEIGRGRGRGRVADWLGGEVELAGYVAVDDGGDERDRIAVLAEEEIRGIGGQDCDSAGHLECL